MIAFMSARKMKKTVFGRANRSGFHKLVCPVRHAHHAPEAKFDAVGGGIAVGLSVGTIFLMRLILAN
jgi:predicted GNAT superfamily acetyltransferase